MLLYGIGFDVPGVDDSCVAVGTTAAAVVAVIKLAVVFVWKV